MTAYRQNTIYPLSSPQAVQKAKEKRKQVLEAVRKRRAMIYQRFQEKLRTHGNIGVRGVA